jgi:tripartite-type tricarboxylate transporter receptor subunit TctC
LWIWLASLCLISLSPTTSLAQVSPVQHWYQGKTLTIVVPHGAGGGFDIYARLLAPFFRRYIPGADVIVRNVTGAGGLIGRNQVYTARPDGLTIGLTTGTAMVFSAWSGLDGVRFDLRRMTHIGRIAYETQVLALSARGTLRSFGDLRKAGRPIKMGFSGIGSDDYYTTAIIAHYFGYKTEPITGYSGSREANLAAVRGEVDAVQVQASSLMPLLRSGDLIPVLTLGLKRDPALPDVPTAVELSETREAREITATLASLYGADRIFFGPPDMTPSLLDFLRRTFDTIVEDREFLDHASKAKRPIDPLKGEEVDRLVRDILRAGAHTIQPMVRTIAKQIQ